MASSMKVEDLVEYIHRFETISIKNEYGFELEGGYGQASDIYAENPDLMQLEVRFIQSGQDGSIEIFTETR